MSTSIAQVVARPVAAAAAQRKAWGQRRQIQPSTAVLLVALWTASIANLPLWQALYALPELADGRGLAFRVTFCIVLAALHVLLLSLLAWRHTLKPVLTLFLLAAAGGAYFMFSYGVVIDRSMMLNVLLTDGAEARELLSLRLLAALTVLGVLPAAASPGPARPASCARTLLCL